MAVEAVVDIAAVLLWTVGGVLGLLLVVGLVALCAPLQATAAAWGLSLSQAGGLLPEGAWRWEVRGLFGLLRWSGVKEAGEPARSQLYVLGFAKTPSSTSRTKDKSRGRRGGPSSKPTRGGQRRVWNLWELWVLWPEVRRLAAGLRRCGVLQAEGNLVYGFDDPALTGWCEAVRGVLPWPRRLSLTPDFSGPQLAGDAAIHLTVSPIRCAAAVVRFLLRRPVRRWWWTQLRQRRRGEVVKESSGAAAASA